jgi:hypothetical protein
MCLRNVLILLIGAALSAPLMAAQDPPELELEPSPQLQPDKASASGAGSALVPGARFSLTHELAARIKGSHDVTNNRTPFRVEYEKHFLDNFYLHFDVIETVFWSNDHRAKALGAGKTAESTVRDAFVQFSKANTSIKVGRQILIWGESDAGAITDVISPRDLSELYFISLEKSRISQAMVTVDQFSQWGDWGFFYIPEAKFNRLPQDGDIYSFDPFNGGAEMRTVDPRHLREYGLRWKKTFGRSDFSVMAARLFDNDRALHQDGFTSDGRLLIKKEPQRFDMVGTTFNLAGEGFLISGEIAKKSPRAFLNPDSLQVVRKDTVDTSLRAEYSLGNGGNHAASLEAVNNHVLDWSRDILPVTRNTNSLVLGWRNSFLNDTLSALWLTVYNVTYTSFTHSLFLKYRLNDHVTLGLDAFYLNVRDSNNALYPFRGQNNAVFRITYQF